MGQFRRTEITRAGIAGRVISVVLIVCVAAACGGAGPGERPGQGSGTGNGTPADQPDSPRQPARPKPSGELVVTYPDEPASLNPYLPEGDSIATRDLLRPVLPTLLSIRPDLRYEPGLATKVPSGKDIRRDPFSVTFHLDPEAVWSDGRPVTAADVRFTWETIKDPRWPIADRTGYDRVTDVVVVDAVTLRLDFDRPYGPWRNLFSGGDFILPKHFLDGKDFAGEFADAVPLSGGPFMLESRTRGLEVNYRANPRFRSSTRDGPAVAKITVRFVPDSEIALRLLRSGRSHVMAATTRPNLQRRMEAISGVKATSRFGASWWQLFYNHSRNGMADGRAREAVAASFDRPGFSEAFLRSDGRLLDGPVPAATAVGAFSRYRKDIQAAKSLAGPLKDTSLVLITPGGNQTAGILGVSLQKQLQQTGFQLEIRSPHSGEFYRNWRRDGDFDIGIWELRGAPGMSLSGMYQSGLAAPEGTNYSRIKSPEIDAALAAADSELSAGPARSSLAGLLARDLPALPLVETKMYLARRPSVTGPDPNASVDGPFWNLESWRAGSS